MIAAESLDELTNKFLLWKNGLESRGLKVNMKKMKVMISGLKLNTLRDTGKYPCVVCRKGIGSTVTLSSVMIASTGYTRNAQWRQLKTQTWRKYSWMVGQLRLFRGFATLEIRLKHKEGPVLV